MGGWDPCLKSHYCLVHTLIKLALRWSYGNAQGMASVLTSPAERAWTLPASFESPITAFSHSWGHRTLGFVGSLCPPSAQAASQTQGWGLASGPPVLPGGKGFSHVPGTDDKQQTSPSPVEAQPAMAPALQRILSDL